MGKKKTMARKIADGLVDSGVKVRVIDINQADRTETIKEMFEAKGYIIGSSTHDNDMLPTLAGFLEFLKGLKPKDRIAAAFGSYGWAGGAIKNIETVLNASGIKVVQPGLGIQYVPDDAGSKQCYEFGKNFAMSIKQGS